MKKPTKAMMALKTIMDNTAKGGMPMKKGSKGGKSGKKPC